MAVAMGALLGAGLAGSGNAARAQANESAPAPVMATSGSTSELLRPSLDMLQQTVNTVRVDKWKCSPAVKDETEANLTSIRSDLTSTLPPLLTTADGAPESIVGVLPVFRNVDALYDVLLRVSETGRVCGSRQQSAALEQAMTSLEGSRRTLGDRLQAAASAQEQKLSEARAALRARPVAPLAPAPVEVAPHVAPPVTHPTKPRKPKPKPPAPAATPETAPAPTL